jgi:nucleoside-diphosphate-sugar epimerase
MDNYSNMKVIITGATGFIGREIVSELSEGGFELYQIGNSNVNSQFPQTKFFKIDITSFEEVCELKKLKGIDAVIHSAGLAHQFGNIEKEKFQKTNVEGTKNILELAVILKVKHFVLISSTAVYGTEKKSGKDMNLIDESATCRPQTFYAESKLEAEQLAMEICGRNNINLTIFRLSPVIGEGNAGNVARLVEAIDKKRFVWIGNGKNYKSLIYKKDVAKACRKILTEKKNGVEVFNLAAEPILMRNFVGDAAKNLNKKIPRFSIPPLLLEKVFRLNEKTLKIKKIRKISETVEKWLSDDVYSAEIFEREYNFKPETSISEALEKQIDWYQKQKGTRGDG